MSKFSFRLNQFLSSQFLVCLLQLTSVNMFDLCLHRDATSFVAIPEKILWVLKKISPSFCAEKGHDWKKLEEISKALLRKHDVQTDKHWTPQIGSQLLKVSLPLSRIFAAMGKIKLKGPVSLKSDTQNGKKLKREVNLFIWPGLLPCNLLQVWIAKRLVNKAVNLAYQCLFDGSFQLGDTFRNV